MSQNKFLEQPLDGTVYRVYIDPTSNRCDVTCLGLDCDDFLQMTKDRDELPDWLTNKVAVLMLMGKDNYMHVVEGVGMRNNADTFYVTAEGQRLFDLHLVSNTRDRVYLTEEQDRHLQWLKQTVQNLKDEKNSRDPRPRIQQELWAAERELTDYRGKLDRFRAKNNTLDLWDKRGYKVVLSDEAPKL